MGNVGQHPFSCRTGPAPALQAMLDWPVLGAILEVGAMAATWADLHSGQPNPRLQDPQSPLISMPGSL